MHPHAQYIVQATGFFIKIGGKAKHPKFKSKKNLGGQAGKEEKMVTDLLIFWGWIGLIAIIAIIDELIKKRKKVRK